MENTEQNTVEDRQQKSAEFTISVMESIDNTEISMADAVLALELISHTLKSNIIDQGVSFVEALGVDNISNMGTK